MNRAEFMRQLESLLQSIAPAEREEALQYYNDYFDDAGKENEQEVIEALGNPARVAENIKRDLFNGDGEGSGQKAQASDRAIIEYGKENQDSTDGDNSRGSQDSKDSQNRQDSQYGGNGQDYQNSSAGYNNRTEWGGTAYNPGQNGTGNAYGGAAVIPKSSGMPGWAIVLLAIALVFASPIIIGVLGTLFGLVVCWLALIFSFGIGAVALLVVLCVLVVVGIMCFPVNPGAGMAVTGAGLICGAIGLLGLMLTVAMAGIVTPAIFKGIAALFRLCRPGRR